MKKSNNTRHNKKLHHPPTDSTQTLNLNRSVPSFADFLDLSSLNFHLKDGSLEPPKNLASTIDHNLKPRTHTKAPSKRLALLLDAYADPVNKKPNYTIDHLEGSFRDGSLRSPQNANSVNEGLKKSRLVRHSGISNSFKALEFFKSKEFSKMAMTQVMTKNNQKSFKQDDKTEKKAPEAHEPHVALMTQASERADEEFATKDISKRVPKSSIKEDAKKMSKSRNDASKQKSTLRKIKVLYTDASIPEGTILNSSLPQTTKNKSNMGSPSYAASHHFTNSVILSQPRSLLSHDKHFKNDALSPHGRNHSSLRRQENNNSVQYADYYSYQPEDREKEKHKKNHSFTPVNSRATVSSQKRPSKELSVHHSKAISTLTTKPETESNRGGLTNASGEKSRLSDYRFLLNNHALSKDSRSGREAILSWSTTRRADGSEQRPPIVHNLHEKRGSEKSDAREKEEGFNKDSGSLNSVMKLEKAFDQFIEENKVQFAKGDKGQAKFEEITKNWDNFISSLDILDKEDAPVSKKKKQIEPHDTKTLKKDDEVYTAHGGGTKKAGMMMTNSTSQSALPTEKKVFKCENNIEKCDTGKANNGLKEELQQTVAKQQSVIESLKKKEKTLMSLLHAIGRKGIDVEKIFRESVKKEAESIESLDMMKPPVLTNVVDNDINEGETIVSLPRGDLEEVDNSQLSQSIEHFRPNDLDLQVFKWNSEPKSTTDTTPFSVGYQNRLNVGMKIIPKLDLTGVNSNNSKVNSGHNAQANGSNGSKGFQLNLKGISEGANNDERPNFHEEFMSKFNEFSLSWRQEAMNQRNTGLE